MKGHIPNVPAEPAHPRMGAAGQGSVLAAGTGARYAEGEHRVGTMTNTGERDGIRRGRDSYKLELASGMRWEIGSSQNTASRLNEFTRILGLGHSNGGSDRRLLFTRGVTLPVLPRTRWKTKKLRLIQFHYRVDKPEVICDLGSMYPSIIEVFKLQDALFPIYEEVQDSGGVPFHSALIERNGMGVVIAAPGGTGKTTCCNRIPRPWKVCCDDDSVIVKGEGGRYMVHPFPTWSRYAKGESPRKWKVERALPLKAIFFLERSDRRDEVFKITNYEAAVRASGMHSQMLDDVWSYLDVSEQHRVRAKFFSNAADLAGAVPSFVLRARIDGRFWEEMEKVLT
jgi:SynChlorMet cassette protein ScmC